MKKHALLVGVEDYRDEMISRLNYARADATALAAQLRRCGFDHVRVMASDSGENEPLLVNIVTALRDAAAELRQDDLFLFFFAGHGMEKDGHGYLLPRDSLQAFPEHGSLSLELLRKTFEHLGAGKRILLLDACRNSPDAGRAEAANFMGDVISRDIVAAARSRMAGGTTTALLSACRTGQRAYEWPAKQHGVFTHYLLEGLSGAAWTHGELAINQLASYAAKQIRQWSVNMPGLPMAQEPWYEQFGDPDSIVLALAQPDAAASTMPQEPAAPPKPTELTIIPTGSDDGILLKQSDTSSRRSVGPWMLVLGLIAVMVQLGFYGYNTWIRPPLGVTTTGTQPATSNPAEQTTPPPTTTTPSTPESQGMVLIPAGSFQMGDSFGEGNDDAVELPVHTVSVSAFYIGKYEVTKALWDEVASWASTHGYDIRPADGNGKAANHPVMATWHKAVKWMNARSEREGLTPAYYTSVQKTAVYRTGELDIESEWVKWNAGYRLPTEAEWEKAARGGTEGHRFPWSDMDTIDQNRANYQCISAPYYPYEEYTTCSSPSTYAVGNLPYTSPVGSFAPNGYGLYDMAGNAWEWVWDFYDKSYYANSPGSDPRGSSAGGPRVQRGCGFDSPAGACRVATRGGGMPGVEGHSGGFREVLPVGQ